MNIDRRLYNTLVLFGITIYAGVIGHKLGNRLYWKFYYYKESLQYPKPECEPEPIPIKRKRRNR